MANAVEDALNRATPEQREKAMQTIEEARRNIQMNNVQMGDISSTEAANVAHNAQVIEDAKRTIPFETMQHVDTVSPPMNTPPMNAPAMHGQMNSNVIELHPDTKNTIESIEQGEGNNYLNQNAVDRALARQAQEMPPINEPQQQRAMGR
jgi:hypothetical protein